MTDAIKASLHSYKSLATRKQLQITLEVPEEHSGTALKMLGVADPSGTQWFALVRVAAEAPQKADARLRSNLAAILVSQNEEFKNWLVDRHWDGCGTIGDHDALLKRVLNITSKADLDRDPEAAERFDRLTTSFAHRDQIRE